MEHILPFLTAILWAAVAISATAQIVPRPPDNIATTVAGSSPYAVRTDDRIAARGGEKQRSDGLDTLPPGDRLLAQAINRLERHQSVTAQLRHQFRLGERTFSGTGNYWQHGSGEALRVRLELEMLGQGTRLVQVSNSRFLWVDKQLPTGRKVTRIDLRQIRIASQIASQHNQQPIQPGKATWSPLEPEFSAHSGGLSALLSSLRTNFNFLPPQAMRLTLDKSSSAESPSLPVFAIVGHWKPGRLESLVKLAPSPPQEPPAGTKGKPTDTIATSATNDAAIVPQEIPPRLPLEVLLLIGQVDSFPYWIEYRRLETPVAQNTEGAAVPYRLSTAPLAVLELGHVVFDQSIPTGRFDYSPGDVDFVDQTSQRIEQLRR